MKRAIIAAVFLAIGVACFVAYQTFVLKAAEAPAQQPRAQPAVPVVVAPVARKSIPFRLDAIGNVQAIATVAVKSRVDGQVAEVKVADGQEVRAGDVLFVLDTRAIEAQLKQAQANLAHDRALLANAQRDVDRLRPLIQKRDVSQQAFDLATATAASLDATVKADEAAIQNLQVQITYYTIRAPIDGRLGFVALKAGNDVKAQDVITMVTINQMRPIYVSFAVPQRELPSVRAAVAKGTVPVSVRVPNDTAGAIAGRLDFIDNQVDVATGTIQLKAIFGNRDERLWPGNFVNVQMTLGVQEDAIVVPAAAIQVGQSGSYVFVVKPDSTAEIRPVTVSRTVEGSAVVASGLSEGERVVTDGQLRLNNGTRVEIRTSAEAPARTERNS
jgi:multidrug efflux system membrane fusion protein